MKFYPKKKSAAKTDPRMAAHVQKFRAPVVSASIRRLPTAKGPTAAQIRRAEEAFLSFCQGEQFPRFCLAKRRKGGFTHRMTRAEIRSLRARTDVSQAKFANLLGVSVRTVQKWEGGCAPGPRSAKLLRQLVSLYEIHCNRAEMH